MSKEINSVKRNYITPYITKESQDRMVQVDVFSELMSKRVVFFGEQVTPESCNTAISQLLWMHSQDPKADISIYINTPGGDVYSGLALHDTIKMVSKTCTVKTVCCGLAASMGSILMCSGTRGHRYALPHSRIMIHQPLSGTDGMTQASDIKILSNEMDILKDELIGILAEASGKKPSEVAADCDRDHWLKATECLPKVYGKYGLIDEIIDAL